MTRPGSRVGLLGPLRILLLGALATLAPGVPVGAATLGFLYVEPSDGSAGGGHFGVLLGGDVYHFQSVGGWLQLQRWDADFFRYAYSVRENRTIHVARVAVDDETAQALAARFLRRYDVARKHRSVALALRHDRQLLELLRTRESARLDTLPFALPGAGLFASGRVDPVLERLRARVASAYGPTYLARSIARVRSELLGTRPYAAENGPWSLSPDLGPTSAYRFSERFADAALKLFALEALESRAGLRPQLRELPPSAASLDVEERRALARLAGALEGRLVELLRSPRPDWGYPVLLGMARLVALDASLGSGRLRVLDAFPSDAPQVDPQSVARRREFFEELRDHEARELRRSRAALVLAGAPGETEYQRLEEAANRLLELDGALAGGRLRLSAGPLLPVGPPGEARVPLPRPDDEGLASVAAAARQAEVSYQRAARRLYGYDLWRHNCVTELFRTVDAVFPPSESVARLGGHVDPDGFLHFVPAAAFEAVLERYRVSEIAEIPSFRRTRLEAMAARDGLLRTRLRESNTLSSSLYRGDAQASAFLFFSEDLVWLRPLFGAFNVLVGLGQLGWGVVSAPFDGGDDLRAGAEGVAFSLPELVFVSLRKGSMAYAQQEEPLTHLRVLESRPSGSVSPR